MSPRMCFLGVGGMGKAMSSNLAQKAGLDSPMLLWNRTLSKAHEHSAQVANTAVAATPVEAVGPSDIVWSCLSNDDAVKGAFESILKEDISGKLFVECSTISQETIRELARQVVSRGGEFVAMPVFGEPSMATAGILTCVPSGPAASVAKVKPYLTGILARAVIDYSGEEPEKSSLLKLVGNTLIISMIESLAEGHVLAEKSGLGTANFEKFIEAVFPGPFMIHSKHMSSGRYHSAAPVGKVGMVKVIASHVMELADRIGTKLPIYEVARKQMDRVEDQVGPDGDIDGLYGAVRVMSGLPYENS